MLKQAQQSIPGCASKGHFNHCVIGYLYPMLIGTIFIKPRPGIATIIHQWMNGRRKHREHTLNGILYYSVFKKNKILSFSATWIITEDINGISFKCSQHKGMANV